MRNKNTKKTVSNTPLAHNVWSEPGGETLRSALRLRARLMAQRHQPPTTLEAWKKERHRLRQRLLQAAGVERDPPYLDLDIREHGSIRLKNHSIIKLTYQSRPGLRVTAHLFRPDGDGPFPAVLNVHGHYQDGRLAEALYTRGQALAREAFVVLNVDAIGAGERGTVPGKFENHALAGAGLFSAGETLLGAQVHDNRRGIDLLQSLPYVIPDRIGMTGASGGGNQTMWVSALDPRVKASVPVVSVGTFEAYITEANCVCETLPDGLTITEEWGVLGLVAPNPMLIITGVHEQIKAFLPHQMLRSYAVAKRIYDLYGAKNNLAYKLFDRPHGYFPDMVDAMLGWFKHWLQGSGSALPVSARDTEIIPRETLMCFPGSTRPREVISLLDFTTERCTAAKAEMLKAETLNRETKIRELRKLLRVPPEMPHPNHGEVVESRENGLRCLRFSVESEKDVLLPCVLHFPEENCQQVVIVAHPNGKEEAAAMKECREFLARNKAVCLVDLRNLGETRWEHKDDQKHLFGARTSLWLGRTMAGDWVRDLLSIRKRVAALASCHDVVLMGVGEADVDVTDDSGNVEPGAGDTTVAVLAAALLDRAFRGVTVLNMPATFAVTGEYPAHRWSHFVPGILKWGDTSLLAALLKCPLQIVSLVNSASRRLSQRERAGWRKEMEEMKERLD